MTRTEALPIARRLAAAVCELNGNAADYCSFMREGAYDDDSIVQAALAGLICRNTKEAAPALSAVSA